MPTIEIKSLGVTDRWDRPLYIDDAGNYYCDTSLGKFRIPDIHFKGGRESEPSHRIENYQVVELTRSDVIVETVKHIQEHGRSLDEGPIESCLYKTKEGNHCAIGRCMDMRKYQQCWEGSGISNLMDKWEIEDIDSLLKEKYRGHSRAFWETLQTLHDRSRNWAYSFGDGLTLSKDGEDLVRTIVPTFNFNRLN